MLLSAPVVFYFSLITWQLFVKIMKFNEWYKTDICSILVEKLTLQLVQQIVWNFCEFSEYHFRDPNNAERWSCYGWVGCCVWQMCEDWQEQWSDTVDLWFIICHSSSWCHFTTGLLLLYVPFSVSVLETHECCSCCLKHYLFFILFYYEDRTTVHIHKKKKKKD